MRDFVLQPWSRIGGSANAVTNIIQDQRGWLDLSGCADAAFWVDVAAVTQPANAPVYGSVTSRFAFSRLRIECGMARIWYSPFHEIDAPRIPRCGHSLQHGRGAVDKSKLLKTGG